MDANESSISLSDEQQQKQLIGNEESSFSNAAAISPSLAAMALNDQMTQQQQQSASRQAPVSLSTPEAYWSASSNLSSAPELTVSSSEALDNGSLFESINRPYTPSYNSTNGLEGALSDQEDYWSGAGSHFEGVDFDFGQELYKGQPNSFSSAYDPETADSYNNLESALLVAHSFSNPNHSSINNNNSSSSSSATSSALSTQQALQQAHLSNDLTPGSTAPTRIPVVSFADQNAFRDPVEKSPIASPLLGAISPHHTRHSSFGSNIGSPTPALDQEQTWMQSLGQRMNLGADDGSQYSRQQYSSNTNSQSSQPLYPWQQQQQQQQQQHGSFVPVFEEEGAEVGSQQQQSQQSGDRAYPSYTYSQQQPESLFEQRRPNEELPPLPLLSINDTTMQEAGFAMGAKAEPKSWQNATGSEWSQVQGNYYPLSLPDNTAPQSGWSQIGHAQAPAPSSSRPPTEDVTNQPKRQDSYDPIRKFLRLDVDMGFVSQQQQQQQQYQGGGDVGRWNAIRKRSNSDFGPSYFGLKDGDAAASPPLFTVVPGGVTDKTPTAMTSGVDWVTEAARQRKLQAQQAQAQAQAHGGAPSNSSIVMAMQQNNGHSMDPLLLQNYHYQSQQHPQQHPQSRYDPASGPMRQRDTSNVRGAAVPYASHSRTSSSSGTSNMAPWAPVSPTLRPSNPPSASPVYRPSNLARSNSASRHRRGAQSEDLSQLARSSNPSEFLNRITAPDGSLAPPNARTQHFSSLAGPTPYGGSGSPAGMAGSSRLNPYRTSHDRHHSASSNHSNASSPGSNDAHDGAYSSMRTTPAAGSMNPPSGPPKVGRSRLYSQTALPTYTSLGSPAGDQAMQAAGAADVATGTFSVPVVQVTTSATQAASASRRKNEAIHVCPIPGCGSTFTRKFNLNGHIRSHTGARPYECREPGCGKSFARSFDLSRHEKLHAGIKPHNCESCGKAFARADALSRHLRNDAGNGGCAARISEEDEEGLTPGSPPTGPRMRNGSSASSSLDSSDELDRQRQERLRDLQNTNEETDRQASHVKRESRFKGYIL